MNLHLPEGEKIHPSQALWQIGEVAMNGWLLITLMTAGVTLPLVIWTIMEVGMNAYILTTMLKIGLKKVRWLSVAGVKNRKKSPKVQDPGMKWCYTCEIVKPLNEFWADRTKQDGKQYQCKTCKYDQDKTNRRSMKHRAKTVYGLTLEQYDEIMSATPMCPICDEPTTVLDHDEKAKINRSPLCSLCNQGLGMFHHDIDRLLSAAKYLETWRNDQKVGLEYGDK